MFERVEDAVVWMEERKFITKGFTAFQSYMASLGNPQYAIPAIHIAGTNGKGSTLQYLSDVLQEGGYRVGTFTSPYLETHFDRIRINGQDIDRDFFLTCVNQHAEEWEQQALNMFEIDFVIAALYFEQQKPDFVLYEVGLGGETDATNVLQPIVCVITNIGMDHTELLGDTYAKIAMTKAGIIKKGVPVITAEQKDECLQVFQKKCEQQHASLYPVLPVSAEQSEIELRFTYRDLPVVLPFAPLYQTANVCCALEVLHYLKLAKRMQISDVQIQEGLAKSKWKGRFERLCEDPLILVDGAHNLEGIQALCSSMRKYSDIHIIFSALKDKNHAAMLEALLQLSADVTVCEFGFYRGTSCEDLARQYPVHIVKDYRKALDEAMNKQGTVLITGSLYFISDVRRYLIEHLEQ